MSEHAYPIERLGAAFRDLSVADYSRRRDLPYLKEIARISRKPARFPDDPESLGKEQLRCSFIRFALIRALKEYGSLCGSLSDFGRRLALCLKEEDRIRIELLTHEANLKREGKWL